MSNQIVPLIAQDLAAYEGTTVKRVNHALKVASFARIIALDEGLDSNTLLTIELAALLHDIGLHEAERRHGSKAGKYQELEGAPIALDMLRARGAEEAMAQRVAHIVGHHHSYTQVDGIDLQIIIEADFLVNIFEEAWAQSAVRSVRDKHFKTNCGRALLETLYFPVVE